jgi:hypothetical protein
MKLKCFLIWVYSIMFFLACLAFPNSGLAQSEESFFILPSQIELLPSSQAKVSLIVLGANDPIKVVRFSVKQTPPNLELAFEPQELKVPGISQLVLKTNSAYIPGNYFLEITADFGDQIKLAVLNLTTRKDLEIKLPVSNISLFPQDQAGLGFYVYKLNPESNPVFQIKNQPPGIEGSFSSPIQLDSYTMTCTLTLTSSMDTRPGVYQLSIIASDGLHNESASLSLTVLFTDVKNHWAQKEISRLVSLGILSGYPDGSFLPDATITRAELAKVLSLTFNVKMLKEGGANFKDLETNYWATPYIERLYKGGVIEGYPDGTFRPQQPVKRSEVASMIARIIAWPLVPKNFPPTFLDLSPDHWAFQYIETGAWQGAWDGYPNGKFEPDREATRAEIAALISRLLPEP